MVVATTETAKTIGSGEALVVEEAEFAVLDGADRNRKRECRVLLVEQIPDGEYVEILPNEFVAPSGEIIDRTRL